MDLKDDLLAIEQRLWTGGGEEYRRHLDDECAIAFTEMAGVFSREQVAGTVEGPDRWRDVEMSLQGLVRPTNDVAVLTYRASAVRGNEERYSALVSSGYVRRDGEWRMMFHQQTPLSARGD